MKLTLNQMQIIIHALSVAADRFIENAHTSDMANQPRLAEQFRKQAADSHRVREYIEDNI